MNKFSNTITKASAPLLLEPSILSSLSTTIKSIKREATILEPITLKLILSTSTYILRRKRVGLVIYTSFRSSSYKLRKIAISSSLSKVVKVIEYKYNIAESQKLNIIPIFQEKLSFIEKLKVLEPIYTYYIYSPRLYSIPYSKYFKKLYSLLSVRYITS